MHTIESRPLGRTGLEVSRLGLGGLFVASFLSERQQAVATVHRAIELGINYIDTAPGYGNSEEVMGDALRTATAPVVLSTKLGGRPLPFDAQDKAGLTASFEESLRLLGRDRIDLLMIHEPDRPGQYGWWTDWYDLAGPVLDLAEEWKARGLIGAVGLGGTTVHELTHLCRTGRFDVVLTAFNYSLLWREAEHTVIAAAREMGMGVIAGSPLQQGALARKYDAIDDPAVYWLSPARREQFRAIYRVADAFGVSIAELAIRFVLSNPSVDTVLMGARSAEEVEKNVAAVQKGPLPSEILASLDAIYQMAPCRPFCEPFGIGWYLGNPRAYRGPGIA